MSTPAASRIVTLRGTGLLDSGGEEAFDRYTRLASRLLAAPVSLVSLVDADRQYFKSQVGLAEPWASSRESPLEHSFCGQLADHAGHVKIVDARLDPRVADNPAVKQLAIGAYLGVPLRTSDGHTLGSLCAIDSTPRDWSAEDLSTLESLAAAVTAEVELRLAAHRLQQERDFATAVMEVAGALVLVLDATGTIVRFNRACSALTGYSDQEMIGSMLWDRLLPSDFVATVRDAFADIARTPVPEEHTGHWITSDGTLRLISWRSTTISGANGEPAYIVSTGIDTTDRAAAEELFRAAFEGAPNGMVLTSLRASDRGRFLRVNHALSDILGFSPQALEEMSFESLAQPGRREESASLLERIATGRSRSGAYERLYVHADGHPVWVSISVSPVRDRRGPPEYAIAQVLDITERKRMERSLAHMAEHDPLTDLLNRRGLHARLSEIAENSASRGRPAAVAVIDLDNFKYVNDTYGHAVGDGLIVRCAEAMQRCIRRGDVLARLGGDEFALVMPETGEEAAMLLAAKLLECLRAVQVGAEERRIGITGSVGVAMIPAASALSPGDLLVAADLAMIGAKEAGRDRAQLADRGSGALALARSHQTWVERIREALSENRLELLAQPIALLDDGSVTRQELLLRMRGEDGELIVPASFLYIAERFDQIQAIDRWTIARAVELLAGGELAGALHVNVSGASITDPELVDYARAQISDAGIDGERLTFEVTETVAIAHMGRARQFAGRLREVGCTFALDDFGSGFGSFYYLKHLPFDYIKIDGEFIGELAGSLEDQLMVRAIASIVRGLGKHSVAEFVRNAPTAALLREYGVDYGQGDHFGAPLPVQ